MRGRLLRPDDGPLTRESRATAMASVFSVESLRSALAKPRLAAAYAALLIGLVAAGLHFPVAVWRLFVETRGLASSTRVERELYGARAIGLETDVFVAARELMPPDAVYYWAARPRSAADPPALDTYGLYAAWWLLPRRETKALSEAEWLVTYGVDPRTLGVRVGPVEAVEPGFSIAKVQR